MFRLVLLSFLLFHPVHESMTSIDYMPDKKSFRVIVKMNFDDFVLDSKQKVTGEISKTDNNISQHKNVMEKYLKEKLTLTANGRFLEGKLEDMRIQDLDVISVMKYGSVRNPVMLDVKNQILTDLYSDMTNMLIIKINDFEEGIKLTSEILEKSVKLK
jgi:hypothetical protein